MARPLIKIEKEILLLIAEGYRDREIAQKLNLGERSTRRHLNNMYLQLGAINRPNAIYIACQKGILK
jgi:DNA-binding NarL/FixJ family response regulator